jgi:glycosyltransferase involved in cell wall biosynthesis
MEQKNILFLAGESFPVQYAFLEKVFNEIILTAHGYKVYWVLASDEKMVKKIKWGDNEVVLVPKVKYSSVLSTAIKYGKYILDIIRAVHLNLEVMERVDLVQVRDDPFMGLIAYLLSILKRVPLVYQVSHLKEEEIMLSVQMGLYRGRGLFLKGWVGKRVRDCLLRRSDLILAISKQMKDTLINYGINPDKIIPLPEGVEPVDELDITEIDLMRQLKSKGKRILIYVGTMAKYRRLDFMLRAVRGVVRTVPEVHLVVLGRAPVKEDEDWLREKAEKYGIADKVTFVGWVSRSEVPAYIKGAEVGLSPFPQDVVLVNNSPIKILEYMVLGKPVVATDIPDQKTIIENSGGGISVPYNEMEFSKAIVELLGDQGMSKKMGEKGKAYVVANRSFSILADNLNTIYEKVVNRK